ncbi:hypothetical protein E0H80_13475 [Acinetobacter sp. ANC 4779]|uniref:hypothetical protein n=1 Tax=Acinetobacter sp. ANC 4779 TaxID=2529848 RepID=UPI0010396906|nr:hypothetical protein [Acinetobacter sp. ANC 4779]TCB48987.1 hypothetical protein E0H80_13475 [Acinetobacter sp. ANC 4779]
MATIRTQWQRIQNYIWLVCGLGCLFAALIFWAITDSKDLVEVEKSAETESELQIQPEKVAATSLLGALQEEVRPLEMTTRVVNTGSYEPEFRGSKFIADNKNATTIELFRVTKDEVIRSFLKKQPDRKNFFYIRLSGENQIEQYVLLYGIYRNSDQAKQALQQLPFQFPKSIQPQVQNIENYAALVNDMGAEEMGSNSKIYAVNLKSAPLPRIDESLLVLPKPKPTMPVLEPKSSASTTTTVTRRDEDGNVVDVQQSHSSVESAPKKNGNNVAETEINDPFN